MIAVKFAEANATYVHATDLDLQIHDNGRELISCWQFSKEDLERVNRTGQVWVRIERTRPPTHLDGAYQPVMRLTTLNPFQAPQKIVVATPITQRVYVEMHDEEELVLLQVGANETAFKAEPFSVSYEGALREGTLLTYDLDGVRRVADASDYIFAEKVRVIGKISETYGTYDRVARRRGWDPKEILVLERVNKTV
jgi:hypothetical protein